MAKLTNEEVYQQIATMSETDAAQYGVTPAIRSTAQQPDAVRAAAFSAPYTPLYNGFVGMIAKFAVTALSKAKYSDIYARHHRNLVQGRPQVGFVKRATEGTGNNSALFSSTPTIGSLTSVVTANQPEIITLYDTVNASFVARVPISPEDVKNAVTSEYGISELITKTREAAEDKIINDRNELFDTQLTECAKTAVATGSEIPGNSGKATKRILNISSEGMKAAINGRIDMTTEDLTAIYTEIKRVYYSMVGRPVPDFNALAVPNNVDKENMVCYIDSDLLAEMETRVAQAAFNLDKLELAGLTLIPTKAPYLGKPLPSGQDTFVPFVAMGSADFIRDYPISDYTTEMQVDRGVIHSRFFDDQLIKAGYEPFVFLGVQSGTVSITGTSSALGYKITVDGVVEDFSSGVSFTMNRPADSVTVEVVDAQTGMTWTIGGVEILKVTTPVTGKVYDITDAFNATTANSGIIS